MNSLFFILNYSVLLFSNIEVVLICLQFTVVLYYVDFDVRS